MAEDQDRSMVKMSEAQLKSELSEVEMLLTAATDIDYQNGKWREKLAIAWHLTGKPVKVGVMKELRQIEWKKVRDHQLHKRF